MIIKNKWCFIGYPLIVVFSLIISLIFASIFDMYSLTYSVLLIAPFFLLTLFLKIIVNNFLQKKAINSHSRNKVILNSILIYIGISIISILPIMIVLICNLTGFNAFNLYMLLSFFLLSSGSTILFTYLDNKKNEKKGDKNGELTKS
ncbi:MAG: hypothetical protein ACRC4L_01760 [Mycoplasma sp.]